MPADTVPSRPETALGRIFRNTAWLMTGRGFGAICSLVYLAILTRTLGLKGFGHFSLIFGTAQALVAIAGFQTWRVVVRYGAEHIMSRDWAKFGRLSMLCGLADAVGAVIGCIMAAVLIYGFAHKLDLNPAYIDIAFWFCCAQLWALVSAPTGIIRALDRFDVGVYVEAVVPLGRLIAALVIWFTKPTVGNFLAAWAIIDLIEMVLYWAMARRYCPEAIRVSHIRNWRQALRENEAISHFFWVTYASSTIEALVRNGPLLVVGAFISTRAAGLYRLASQISQALSKLSSMLTRSVYAEVARARVASDAREFRKLVLQTTRIAGLAGIVVIAVAMLAGEQILVLIGGDAYEGGAAILVPLTLASCFDLASVAFEPVLHSTGRARHALFARGFALVCLAIALWVLVPMGTSGAAWAVTIGGAASYLAMGVLAWFALRGIRHEERAGSDGTAPPPDPGAF